MAEANQPKPELTLLSAIEELVPTETIEVRKILKHPAVIKYFRAMGMRAVFANASLSTETLAQMRNNDKYLVEQAYQKGILDVCETVLNETNKE